MIRASVPERSLSHSHITMQEIQFEKHISMLISVSLNQIIIVYLNNYMCHPFIGPYKDNFSITTDMRLKITKTNKTLHKESYTSLIPITLLEEKFQVCGDWHKPYNSFTGEVFFKYFMFKIYNCALLASYEVNKEFYKLCYMICLQADVHIYVIPLAPWNLWLAFYSRIL